VGSSHLNLSRDHSLIKIFIERDDAGGVGVGPGGVAGSPGLVTVSGAFLTVFIPEVAAFPDAIAQAGKGADGDGAVWHVLRNDDGLYYPIQLMVISTKSIIR
jgi:hypothetical protein